MKRFLPRTLPSWLLLILIAGLVATQTATLSIVSRDRADNNNFLELFRLSERADTLVKLLYAAPAESRQKLAANISTPSRPVSLSDIPVVKSAIASDDTMAELEDVLVARMSSFGVVDVRIRRDMPETEAAAFLPDPADQGAGVVEQELSDLAADFSQSERLMASIQFRDGQWVNFSTPISPVDPILTPQTLPLYGTVAALVIIMSIWAMRRLTAPYQVLEKAVERIGADVKNPPLPEIGPAEYRSAARAVNAMQERLKGYIAEREHLAAALAHDLRTPLTRARLRLEMLRNAKLRQALANDLNDIDAIVKSVIDFANYEIVEEEKEKIDFWSLIDSIADEYPQISFGPDTVHARGLICYGQPVALRRCITNLIDNAVTYGKAVTIDLFQTEQEIVLTIADRGPGIPKEKLDEVFEPFSRLEGSRNRKTGGFGLGLTIARGIARRAGGDIVLANGPEGGLQARLILPRLQGSSGSGVSAN
ncbi:ATP-binding protein [Brucella sp. IR073]|uniref:ATP-binding protein n=1 Tax=unclassified Brucella TaxID=2632610 RepID=UPI003B980356